MNSSRALSALKHRNFKLFWSGQLISLSGTWMHHAAQNWLVYTLTDSPFFLGLSGMTTTLPILLFTLAGGIFADRHHKKNIILTTQITLLILALTLAILVATNNISVWIILIIAFFIGTANAFEIPARQSFIVEMVGKKDLLNAIALNSSAFHAARMTGPAIAGFLIQYLGMAACFFINSFSFLAAIGALLKMRFKPEEIKTAPGRGVAKEFKEGMRYIVTTPEVYTLILTSGIISFFGFPYINFLPVYAKDILETGAKGLGMLMGFAGAGAFTGAVLLAFRGDNAKKGQTMAAAGITFSIALMIFALSRNIWTSYAMLYLMGLGAISQIATANSLIQITVPDSLRGRVMSSFTTMFLGMAPLGNLALGTLAHYTNTQTALATGAGLCLLGTLMALWKKPVLLKM
jgi:MFS family permease